MFSRHVTKNISAYCHDELTAEEARQFNQHILVCAKCRTQFEQIKLGIRFAEHLPQFSAPENLWRDLEAQLKQGSSERVTMSFLWRPQVLAVAAVLLLCISLAVWWVRREGPPAMTTGSWVVERLNGTPRINSTAIRDGGQLGVGQWLETDGNSRAKIMVASIGQVEVDPNTRIRLLQTQPTEHRLELARGKMSARIWAPPRLFFVDTPSAVAADLGCAYTLQVDDSGASLLRVTSGWVALELKDRESMVPAGAACETHPGIGPGTPYFEDVAPEFRQALKTIDFGNDAQAKDAALDVMLKHTRQRDTLTLWHLLGRLDVRERGRVFDKVSAFVPPPDGVTREGVLKLDEKMLDRWREDLEPSWAVNTTIPKKVAEAYWRIKNGVQDKVSTPK